MAVLDDYRSLEMVQHGRQKKVVSRLRQDKGHSAEWEAFARTILERWSGSDPLPAPGRRVSGVLCRLQALRQGGEVCIAAAL